MHVYCAKRVQTADMEQLSITLDRLAGQAKEHSSEYRPSFFRLGNREDAERLALILERPGIQVSNELHSQLRELVKSLNPKQKLSSSELDEAAKAHLGNTPQHEYGVWVYYPWLNKVVHILDEEEYRNIRTNRNQFKITPEERDQMSTQKIGVIGLSVGQSVAITLAMERTFGELRIADFDVLELSNLNRIRSGVQDLEILKTVSTARQIAEIDPFLNVTCFHEGLTEDNLHDYFTGNGKLDILVDECDGLDIKILARLKARELGIPVVMETSDRGMIDIERFDLEPDRPIMHGLIDHLDQNPNNLKGLSNEQKIPYILPMLGLDTMSDRLKASFLEVEQSITTWPQLASDVILGGAVSANVCRRISLDQFRSSGRFFVDMNEIVSPENVHQFQAQDDKTIEYEEEDTEVSIHREADSNQLNLNTDQVHSLVEAAIWAPSGGNSQPWRWVYDDKTLYLLLDKARATSFLDYASAGSYLSLGAATENLILKAHQMGLEVAVEEFPDADDKKLAASFRFYEKGQAGSVAVAKHEHDQLADAIHLRLTNRLLRERKHIDSLILNNIKEMGETIAHTSVKIITDPDAMNGIGKLIAKGDRILITHKDGHHGFVNEIRWSDEEAARTKDGVDIATIDLSAGEAAGFRMAKNWSVVKTLNTWGGGGVFEKLSNKGIAGASAIGLITIPGPETEQYFTAGKALERLWLYANKTGVAIQPMTGITFMLNRLIHGNGENLTPGNIKELTNIKEDFYNIFGLSEREHPAFLFRMLVADEPKVKAMRRPVEEVLKYK